jgi:hypothetical protein
MLNSKGGFGREETSSAVLCEAVVSISKSRMLLCLLISNTCIVFGRV